MVFHFIAQSLIAILYHCCRTTYSSITFILITYIRLIHYSPFWGMHNRKHVPIYHHLKFAFHVQ